MEYQRDSPHSGNTRSCCFHQYDCHLVGHSGSQLGRSIALHVDTIMDHSRRIISSHWIVRLSSCHKSVDPTLVASTDFGSLSKGILSRRNLQ